MLFIRPVIKLLKALRIKHTYKIVHTGVRDWDHTEDGSFLLAQAAKIHFIYHRHPGILRNIKRSQAYSSTH